MSNKTGGYLQEMAGGVTITAFTYGPIFWFPKVNFNDYFVFIFINRPSRGQFR